MTENQADVEPPRKKTFKFSFCGVDLDALFYARVRIRFHRGYTCKPMALIKKLRKAKLEAPTFEKPVAVRSHLFNMNIVPSKSVTIPDELFSKILSLLKVKSLLRLKCVSKSFNSLITDALFVKMHLNKSSQIPYSIIESSNYLLSSLPIRHIFQSSPSISSWLSLFSKRNSRYIILNPFPLCLFFGKHRFLEKDKSIILANHHIHDQRFYNNYCDVVGSCNGLLCLVFHSPEKNRKFFLRLCNPATRSLSEKLAYFRTSETSVFTDFRFSFGYDNLTAKYKVVAYCLREVKVFTLGDNNNSWRSIPSFPKAPYQRFGQNLGVYLSNSLNWLSLSTDTDCDAYYHPKWHDYTVDQFVIISLDLGTETCMEFPPPRGFDEVPPFVPKISLLTDCLCFSYYSYDNYCVIWKMREFGVQDSWTKLFKFSCETPSQGYLDELYGYLVPLHHFESDNSIIFVNEEGFVRRYNSRENKVQGTGGIKHIHSHCNKHYVESLVSTC